jgi:glycosyltransferase involved in cell wall biosynthesis
VKKPKIAFVVQRFGLDVNGGAETLCRLIAERMIPYWEIDVLTSSAKDYVKRFQNEFPPGEEIINDVTVRRFEIDYLRSDDKVFSRLDEKVLRRESNDQEEALWLKEIGPYSSTLISYIQEFQDQYDLFFFFTYLYATTTLILPMVQEKSFLVPAAHDETPIHARFFDDFFALPKGLIFSTQEEKAFLRKKTSDRMAPAFVIGVGLDPLGYVSPDSFRQKYQIHGEFMLYVGRIQTQKGCDELFDFYLTLPLDIRTKYPLVLIGKSAMNIPENEHIMPVGFVSDEMKYNAIAAAELVIMPSRFESLNMVILESWLCETSVLVNGDCDVLREQCRKSNGGLWYNNYEEFEACLRLMLTKKDLSERMGIHGKDYVEKNYSWGEIERRYLKIVQESLEK